MAELGEELRRERVRRNLTFKDVEQVLHIKTTYLEAIEDGNYDIIPGQVYVKGFIRNYGNYLDLDGDRLVKVYQGQVGDIDTFSLRSVTRRKAQATPNLVQSEFVEYQTSKKRMSLENASTKTSTLYCTRTHYFRDYFSLYGIIFTMVIPVLVSD